MLFALFKKWWGWDIFHPTRTYSSLKFNLKCDFRVLSSFIYYHHHLWYIVVICRTKNLTFLWASFRKWLHLLAANDLKEQRNWICQKFLMDFPQPELYLPPLIFTKLSFFWDTLYVYLFAQQGIRVAFALCTWGPKKAKLSFPWCCSPIQNSCLFPHLYPHHLYITKTF